MGRLFAVCAVAAPMAFLSAEARAAAYCPMIHAPVCALKNGVATTYSNACLAKAAHARYLHFGGCDGADQRGRRGSR
jgi:hypothetical protein